ncbi:MAG: VWA domain-containing protein [Magnetococcales bacterium]|nr:VWA domain-containing protein [Magnetococcales bacterium]
MEEYFGKLWHRLISQASSHRYPTARVTLEEVATTVGILFRAMGGGVGLRVEAVPDCRHDAPRDWWQRLAGNGSKTPWAWCDEQSLRLPAVLDVFPQTSLNRDLYLWLAALAAQNTGNSRAAEWFQRNQNATWRLLEAFPGLRPCYVRLVAAHLVQRPDPATLPPERAQRERAIRAALHRPEEAHPWPPGKVSPWPVPLWLHPAPPMSTGPSQQPMADSPEAIGDSSPSMPTEKKKRSAHYVEPPRKKDGLLLHRFESLFSWTDFIPVDRSSDEEEDLEEAARNADDLDRLSLVRDQAPIAKRIRFDLDLPSEMQDDLPLGPGILLPEWDYRKEKWLPDYCNLIPMVARHAGQCELPESLRRSAQQLRGQFGSLKFSSHWLKRQRGGSEIDLDAYLDHQSACRAGRVPVEDRLYRDLRLNDRDLACLLLADLSLSTDTWISDHLRTIDVIRDALFLFSEALSASRDRFALYGFSSRRREHIRFHEIKSFHDPYDARIRGRIQAIRPGFYTRMGAAIRYAGTLLSRQPASKRLLLLLTDGKPNDIDHYEGRYGIEDTRMALLELKQWGIQPFCVTIDREAGAYSTHVFGPGGFALIKQASALPRQLPLLYHRLTS